MRARNALALVLVGTAAAGCDKSGPLADLDAQGTWVTAPSASASATAPAAPTAPVEAGRVMPPRPVPTTSPTVRITMPMDVQLQAIQYMAAMQAPQPSDPPADPAYAKDLAEKLRPVGKVDVISSGRLIDVRVGKCVVNDLPNFPILDQPCASQHTELVRNSGLCHAEHC